MPRITNRAILKAHRQHPLLPLLLRECRSHISAKNELRWLRDRALSMVSARENGRSPDAPLGWRSLLRSMCHSRSRGVPLQYILGDQPFGDLEILCERGVLVPRAETESITLRAAGLILDAIRKQGHSQGRMGQRTRNLRIVDLCTGTGCIALLMHALLAPHINRLSILGIDLSPMALELANKNLAHNVRLGSLSKRALKEVYFEQGNVLARGLGGAGILQESQTSIPNAAGYCDVLISNPPYISPRAFRDGTTSRSVRIFEPKLALVPTIASSGISINLDRQEDIFYYHIISLSFEASAKLVVLECGDRLQAERVRNISRTLAHRYGSGALSIDIWACSSDPFAHGGISLNDEPCAVVLRRTDIDTE
ncbi:S-adenosyl-L-methionine-dependent methyltransferase [Aspergillus avenaceus]|uniref:S-adenosyl-L-methionine-dependent methyltransferase n=1 Tax=Aspergillus avenaceus TaxID=36643 RepID=A0A5N6THG4_ASPAV|nr:S-adenosyl-L-methionine-dependent methyltransferase [Aspergillus avenaceus]